LESLEGIVNNGGAERQPQEYKPDTGPGARERGEKALHGRSLGADAWRRNEQSWLNCSDSFGSVVSPSIGRPRIRYLCPIVHWRSRDLSVQPAADHEPHDFTLAPGGGRSGHPARERRANGPGVGPRQIVAAFSVEFREGSASYSSKRACADQGRGQEPGRTSRRCSYRRAPDLERARRQVAVRIGRARPAL